MPQHFILYPVLAQVALTFLVWITLYRTRIAAVKAKRIRVQSLANKREAQELLKEVAGPSDNFSNLFELPVLFYVAAIVIHITGLASWLFFGLLTLFVVLRAVHSVIHATYNKVMHRFYVYAAGASVLWAIWLLIAIRLIFA